MERYIDEVKRNLQTIAAKLTEQAREWYPEATIRFATVSYRDHDKDIQYERTGLPDKLCVAVQPFSEDASIIENSLASLKAASGDDFAEAVEDALSILPELPWNPVAAKCVIWIGDACCHGWVKKVKSSGPLQTLKGLDFFPEGCPCGVVWEDALDGCRTMGIHIAACHTLPSTKNMSAVQKSLICVNRLFFNKVADRTSGRYIPLTDAKLLPMITLNHALTVLDVMRLQEAVALVAVSRGADLGQIAHVTGRQGFIHKIINELGYKTRKSVSDGKSLRLSFEEVTLQDINDAVTGMRKFMRACLARPCEEPVGQAEELLHLFIAAIDILTLQ
ncbi:hypothetical protein M427DRAFT_380925 [Gonapodya prolifera JEL478]|uniref:Uncharacterized protein n=1 Tax=Gonapodya prolifera (strain JEL478) TaxID=1344416 RepID=A0A139AVD7_GONPJ|nr:hypothetical protein M427DRAFT_380925 [Gonapodya prolifera JEL478]|eukprot:KXS20677.1 hypothetical protein M427DRAFT_380925 [Gonapodya prolifera JEL478]